MIVPDLVVSAGIRAGTLSPYGHLQQTNGCTRLLGLDVCGVHLSMAGKAQVPAAAQAREEEWPFERRSNLGLLGGTIAGYQAVSARSTIVSTMASFLSRQFSFEEQGQRELRSECSNQRDPPTPPVTVAPRQDLEAYLDQLSSSASHLDRPVVVMPPNFGTMVEDQMQLLQRAHAAARGWLSASNIAGGCLDHEAAVSDAPHASRAAAQVEGRGLAAAMVQTRGRLQREALLAATLQEGSHDASDAAEATSSCQSSGQADGRLLMDLLSQPAAEGSGAGFDGCNPFEHAAAELAALDAKLASVQGSTASSRDEGAAAVACELHASSSEGSKDEELAAIRDRYHSCTQIECAMIAWAVGAIFLGLALRRRYNKAAGAEGDSTGAPQLQECSRPKQPPLVPPPPRLPPELSSASTHGRCSQIDPRVPSSDGRGPCVYVDTASQLTAAVRDLSQCERIALDVVHGGGSDVLWLQRDFNLFIVNLFDTEKACQVLGWQQRSLGYLLHRFCGIQANKSLGQLADWRVRPLPAELLDYARMDVRHLLFLADCLRHQLVAGEATHAPSTDTQQQKQPQGQGQEQEHSLLQRALHRSQAVAMARYQPTPPATAVDAAATGLLRRAAAAALEQHSRLTAEQVQELETVADCIHALAGWRDSAARAADEGLQCLLPDASLLRLAQAAAASVDSSASNLFGRYQGLDAQQLLDFLPPAAVGVDLPTCGCFPSCLKQQARQVAALLSDAASGQRPWVNADVQQLLSEARGGGGGSAKSARMRDPAARKRFVERFAAKTAVYEGCRMYSRDCELLCHTDRKKLEWYVMKGLAVKVCDEPLAVRLTFQHQTSDQQQGISEFYTSQKANMCVACGETGHYLRYRVVPACYRKALPERLKSHRSHDVLLLCVGCHALAASAAEKLKRQLAEELGVPLAPPPPGRQQQQQQQQRQQAAGEGAAVDVHAEHTSEAGGSSLDLSGHNVRRSALALQRYGDQIPEDRRRRLVSHVKSFLGTQLAPPGAGETQMLSEAELYGGLLAGLGPRTRRRMLRRWLQQGRTLPAVLAAEASAAAAAAAAAAGESLEADEGQEEASQAGQAPDAQSAGTAASGDEADVVGRAVGLTEQSSSGHAWHGQHVVCQLSAGGGDEALLQLCCRFRQCFAKSGPPLKINPRKTRGNTECAEELNAFFSCMALRGADVEDKCAQERRALTNCATAAARKGKAVNTVNYHLQRIGRMLRR
ncbi:Protein RRP6-like 3 [Chlorella vulgaris]